MQERGFFNRLASLWRGFWGIKLEYAEASNAEAVYHDALARHRQQEERLRDAITRLVYLRNRGENELLQHQQDLQLVEAALERAVAADDDKRALALVSERRRLSAEQERLAAEHERMARQVTQAKEGLREVARASKQLERERGEMLARKVHAEARLSAAQALQSVSFDMPGVDRALAGVRESIARLEQSANLDDLDAGFDDAGGAALSLPALRSEAADLRDRQELAELKQARRSEAAASGEQTPPALPARTQLDAEPLLATTAMRVHA